MGRTQERNCSGCRFWSEMVAQAGPNGMEALCLGEGSSAGKYVTLRHSCEAWKLNSFGSVDEPPDCGEIVRESYRATEGMRWSNGAPLCAPDGTGLDRDGKPMPIEVALYVLAEEMADG